MIHEHVALLEAGIKLSQLSDYNVLSGFPFHSAE